MLRYERKETWSSLFEGFLFQTETLKIIFQKSWPIYTVDTTL